MESKKERDKYKAVDLSEAIREKITVVRPLGERLKSINERYFLNEGDMVLKGNGGVNTNAEAGRMSKMSHAWTRVGNSLFISRKPNQEEIPAGLYDICTSMQDG